MKYRDSVTPNDPGVMFMKIAKTLRTARNSAAVYEISIPKPRKTNLFTIVVTMAFDVMKNVIFMTDFLFFVMIFQPSSTLFILLVMKFSFLNLNLKITSKSVAIKIMENAMRRKMSKMFSSR